MRYLLRRAIHAALLLLGVSLFSFLLTALAPGDYFDEMRLNPQVSPATAAALRAQYGADQPLVARYLHWMSGALRGDLGFSFGYNTPVTPLLWERSRNTLLLTVTALLLSWALGLLLGAWSAQCAGRWPERATMWATAVLLVLPDIALALALMILAVQTGWLPAAGMTSLAYSSRSPAGRVADAASHLVIPVAVLVLSALPVLVRHVHAALSDALEAPFVRAAAGHGISKRRLLFRYALPAAANPLISLFGISLGTLLSGSLIVETVTGWPGLGPLLLESILARDLYVVVGGVLLSAVFLIGGNLAADLLLYAADPRIRAEGASQ